MAAILVIDDEPLVAQMIRRTIEDQHVITVQNSATAALALIDGGARFDVVITDLQMPGGDGIWLSDTLAQRNPALARRGEAVPPCRAARADRSRSAKRRLSERYACRSRRRRARSSCPSRNCSMLVPSTASCCGMNEARVSPGSVFSSRKIGPRSETIRSVRE